MRIYSATDVGQKRKMNQDYVFATADPVGNLPNLFVVADGMGGHNAGDYASSHAVTSMVEEIRQDADFNPVKVIRHAIECVNTEILTQAQQDEKLRGMGTTMVAATIVGHYAYVANVGDSRLYVIGEKIQQITRDHSLVQEMVRMGELDPEQARKHPIRPPTTAPVIGSIPDFIPIETTVKNTATIRVTLEARPSRPSVKLTPFTVPITAKKRTGTASHPRFRKCPLQNGILIVSEISVYLTI